jgi:hypothetical protein
VCRQIAGHLATGAGKSRRRSLPWATERRCPGPRLVGQRAHSRHCGLTKDLRYESKLSREMLKGSFSASRLRWFDEVVETLDLECQKLGFSCCGDGWRKCQPRSRRWTIRGPLMRPHACI